MLDYDFSNSIGYWTKMAADAYFRELEAEVRPHGITWRQCQVLGFLALRGEPLTQTELAEGMGIEPPTLVGILDRMERDGWIRRDDCPGDRRKKRIVATREAEPAWAKIAACAKKVRHRATSGIKPKQLAELKRLLNQVRQNLEHGAIEDVA